MKTIANKNVDSEKHFNIKVMVEDNGDFVLRDTTTVSIDIKLPYLAMSNKEFKRFYIYVINLKSGKQLKGDQLADYENLKKKSLGYRTNEERWIRVSH